MKKRRSFRHASFSSIRKSQIVNRKSLLFHLLHELLHLWHAALIDEVAVVGCFRMSDCVKWEFIPNTTSHHNREANPHTLYSWALQKKLNPRIDGYAADILNGSIRELSDNQQFLVLP